MRKEPYENIGLGAWRLQILTKTMIWELGGSKTLRKQWFGGLEAPKPYKNNGLGDWGLGPGGATIQALHVSPIGNVMKTLETC